MILEDAAMPGIGIEDEFRTGDAAREVARILARHHDVMIAVRDEHRRADRLDWLRRLQPPCLDRRQLGEEGRQADRLVAIRGAQLQPREKGFGRAPAVGAGGEEQLGLGIA